ncbi:MAG: hypothetical protein AAB437_00960 [Patescibacteria group bacterium]
MSNTENLKKVLPVFERASSLLYKKGSQDFKFYSPFPTRKHDLLEMFTGIEEYIRPNMFSLDIGSAGGRLLFGFAFLGLNAIGIEALKYQVERANNVAKIMERKNIIKTWSSKTFWGNYFPPDFQVDEKVKWDDWPDDKKIEVPNDVYQDIGIKLNGFDVLTVFQFKQNSAETLRLVSERCKNGALVVTWNLPRSGIPRNFSLLKQSGFSYIYRIKN